MQNMHEYLATAPFDLYELYLFHLVVKHHSFTGAAAAAGLTQSAITRQVQGIEASLGIELLERTTRSVRLTPAGEFLFRESARLIGDVEKSLQRLREEFAGAKKRISVGVSRSIALSHLPGFFYANRQRLPEVSCRLVHQSGRDILTALENNELDLGVLCPPPRLPATMRVTHRFKDAFTLIAPADQAASFPAGCKVRQEWMARQNWLLIEEDSNTGRQLGAWMKKQGWHFDATMRLDNFDLIINLVALGFGASFVPIRALALYGRKRRLQRIRLPERFARELVVVVRRHRKLPRHIEQFIQNVLF
jgi:DNA-binding transcriptional LysR family regulator